MAENVTYQFARDQEGSGNEKGKLLKTKVTSDAVKIIRKIITKFNMKEHVYTLKELTHNEKEKVEEYFRFLH